MDKIRQDPIALIPQNGDPLRSQTDARNKQKRPWFSGGMDHANKGTEDFK